MKIRRTLERAAFTLLVAASAATLGCQTQHPPTAPQSEDARPSAAPVAEPAPPAPPPEPGAVAQLPPEGGGSTRVDTRSSAGAARWERKPEPAPKSEPAATVGDRAPREEATREVCRDCGVITAIEEVQDKGPATAVGTGLGAVVGGIAGAVVGHQFGRGGGKDAATAGGAVAGAVGGALAGREIEKGVRKTTRWVVRVRMDDGKHRTVTLTAPPDYMVGDPVKLVGGALTPAR